MKIDEKENPGRYICLAETPKRSDSNTGVEMLMMIRMKEWR